MVQSTRTQVGKMLAGLALLAISGCGGTREFTAQRRRESNAPSMRLSDSDVSNSLSFAPSPEDDSDIDQVAYDDTSPAPLPPVPIGTEPDAVQTAEGWTLSQLEAFALQNNPAIHQASASAHKSMGYRDQVGRRPNPTVGYQGTQLADAVTDQHVAFI